MQLLRPTTEAAKCEGRNFKVKCAQLLFHLGNRTEANIDYERENLLRERERKKITQPGPSIKKDLGS